MANGNGGALKSVVTAVVTASLISAGGAYVSLKVQERDIEANTSDILSLEKEVRDTASGSTRVQTRITKLETQVEGNERVHESRYGDIARRLKSLQDGVDQLLRRPRR